MTTTPSELPADLARLRDMSIAFANDPEMDPIARAVHAIRNARVAVDVALNHGRISQETAVQLAGAFDAVLDTVEDTENVG